MSHSECLLKKALSKKHPQESLEDYLDRLAIRLAGSMRPLTPMLTPSTTLHGVPRTSPQSSTHSNSKSTTGGRSTLSPSISRTSSGHQSLSMSVPATLSDSHPVSFAESYEQEPMEEVHTPPFPSLFHEMRHASEQQTTPPTTSYPLHSPIASMSFSTPSRTQTPSQSPSPPPPQFVRKANFIVNFSQVLNQSLEALDVTRKENGVFQMGLMTRPIFNYFSFTFQVLLQLIDIGNAYLQTWLDMGRMRARMLLCRMLLIHPIFTQMLSVLISSLLSLHPATIFYSCLLYIQEAIVLATEVDTEIIVA